MEVVNLPDGGTVDSTLGSTSENWIFKININWDTQYVAIDPIYLMFYQSSGEFCFYLCNESVCYEVSFDKNLNLICNIPGAGSFKTHNGSFLVEIKKDKIRFVDKYSDAIMEVPTPSVITSKSYVCVGSVRYDGSYGTRNGDATINNIFVRMYPHQITFKDWDGSVLKTESIDHLRDAIPPLDITRQGYKFVGWDKSYINIRVDTTVTAQYEARKINIRNLNIDNLYIGNNPISKIYLGNNLLYNKLTDVVSSIKIIMNLGYGQDLYDEYSGTKEFDGKFLISGKQYYVYFNHNYYTLGEDPDTGKFSVLIDPLNSPIDSIQSRWVSLTDLWLSVSYDSATNKTQCAFEMNEYGVYHDIIIVEF